VPRVSVRGYFMEESMADESIGALWLQQGQNGTYMSGVVEIGEQKHKIVVFKNRYKQEEKHPDYRILPKREKSQQGASEQQGSQQPQSFEDDVPF